MCAKYATLTNRKNGAITYFVDNVLYDGLLDGKVYPSDFSNKFKPLQELQTAIEEDHETTNENARRFLALLIKTLLPATSVILKITAAVVLIVAGGTPLTAGLMYASAIALDTVTQILKSRLVCDILVTFLAASDSGQALNKTLSNRYVKKVSSLLLHEVVTGSIRVCHSLSEGNFFK
ncbi:hypothetical protein BIW11_03356 [Tropilaelaps mercedesae]|uniref:Uncharacterized protein n=1 Tax=Tropilaelaps mercedesae TaxID=418985 RepID=A0A1V9XN46_9ACAR|nr:hypothetical protein BIW11_03356 [Tropilaelaps mercedesae]